MTAATDEVRAGDTVEPTLPRSRPVEDTAALAAARRGDGEAFGRLVAPHRAAIRAHCYRMLGSLHDAEDVTQEVLMRAWRHLDGFDGRAPVGAWLYRIATNACLTVLTRRARRRAPQEVVDLAPPGAEDGAPGATWIEPYPDAALAPRDPAAGPEATVTERESIRLAFVAALQHLPPRQRAALLLRDVLGYSTAETADLLATSIPAVNSALQRARETVRLRVDDEPERDPAAEREVVDRFMGRWAAGDWDGVARLLAADVLLTMPPFGRWFRGPAAAVGYVSSVAMDDAGPARLVLTSANGLPALACYLHDDDGRDACIGIMLLRLHGGRVAEIIGYPGLDPAPFGLAAHLDGPLPSA